MNQLTLVQLCIIHGKQIVATPFKTNANRDDKNIVNMADIKIVYK